MVKLEFFTKQDFNLLITWINSEEALQNWTGAMFTFPLTHDKLDWYTRGANDRDNPDVFIYKAVDADSGQTIGHISLGGISTKNSSARISRVLVGGTAKRGKGYCTAMVQAVLQIGFEDLGLHRIELGVYTNNKPAIRCYEKCGFIKEGVLRDVLKYGDEYWSLLEMSMLEDEWRQLNHKKAA